MFVLTRKKYVIRDIILISLISLLLGKVLSSIGVIKLPLEIFALYSLVLYCTFAFVKLMFQTSSGSNYIIHQWEGEEPNKVLLYSNKFNNILDGISVPGSFLNTCLANAVNKSSKKIEVSFDITKEQMHEAMETYSAGLNLERENNPEFKSNTHNFMEYMMIVSILKSYHPDFENHRDDVFEFASYIYFTTKSGSIDN